MRQISLEVWISPPYFPRGGPWCRGPPIRNTMESDRSSFHGYGERPLHYRKNGVRTQKKVEFEIPPNLLDIRQGSLIASVSAGQIYTSCYFNRWPRRSEIFKGDGQVRRSQSGEPRAIWNVSFPAGITVSPCRQLAWIIMAPANHIFHLRGSSVEDERTVEGRGTQDTPQSGLVGREWDAFVSTWEEEFKRTPAAKVGTVGRGVGKRALGAEECRGERWSHPPPC